MNFDQSIEKVLRWEGANGEFTNDPDDPGGATRWGITLATLQVWRGQPVTPEDVRRLTLDEAKAIYKRNYWDRARVEDLPEALRGVYFDFAVNAGPGRACSILQRAINALGGAVVEDGLIGPQTIAASHVPGIANEFTDQRIAWYRRLAASNPTMNKYLRGWINRAEDWR